MSTKIYDGLITTNTNVFDTSRKVTELLFPIVSNKFYKLFNQAATHVGQSWNVVLPYYDGKDIIENKYTYLLKKDLYAKLANDSNCTFENPLYQAYILENGNVGDMPLMLIFSDLKDEYIDVLKSNAIVMDYGYWNNSDKPDDVSSVEWKNRRKAWDKLSVPATDGLMLPTPTLMDIELNKFVK